MTDIICSSSNVNTVDDELPPLEVYDDMFECEPSSNIFPFDGTRRIRDCLRPIAVEREELIDLVLINPAEWNGKEVPVRDFLVPGLVPAGTVTILAGDGAAGKSTLALQLGVARAIGRTWLGCEVRPGRTLYLSAEDDADELHRRVDALRNHYGVDWQDLSDLTLVDLVGRDAVLGMSDRNTGIIKSTNFYDEVSRMCRELTPDLVVVDALADCFAGLENDRQQARQFVGLLKKLAKKYACTVMVIAHPSQAGLSTGSGTSGSTAWNNSVRSRLYLSTDLHQADLRTLKLMKANYAPLDFELCVRYHQGAFLAEEGGDIATRKLGRELLAQRKFLELLEVFETTGQRVSPNPGSTYAPKRFAEHANAGGVTKSEFADALQNALSKRACAVVTDGPPSKRRTFLKLAKEEV
jgi:RecA-family ATPase